MKSVILTIILTSIFLAAGIVGGIYWERTNFDRALYLTCIDKVDTESFSALILGKETNNVISSCRAFIVKSKMMLENPARTTDDEVQALEQATREFSSVWSVQVDAFTQQEYAHSLVKKLKNKGYDAFVDSNNINEFIYYRVRVGHLATQDEAKRLLKELQEKERFTKAILANGV